MKICLIKNICRVTQLVDWICVAGELVANPCAGVAGFTRAPSILVTHNVYFQAG
jgi:hypothetical protein